MDVTEPFVPDSTRTKGYRAFRALVHGLWAMYYRPEVIGQENVPSSGPFIIAPVHRSNVDFAFAIYVTERKTFFIAKDSLWEVKPLGKLISTMGAFPVHRGAADRTALDAAERVLRAGEPLVLFPEGTRQDGAELGPLLEGAAFLSARTGAPIVPVGISGTDRSMPRGKKIPRPVKVRVVIGRQVPPAEGGDGARVPRSRIKAATEQLRVELQSAYDRACGRLSAPATTS